MNRQKTKSKPPATKPQSAPQSAAQGGGALLEAIARVLAPLVKLLIARGVTYQAASEMLKRVYVRAGQKHFTGEEATGTQLSLLTGLNRKEIRRLTDESVQSVAPDNADSYSVSYAAAVHAAWITQRRFRDRQGGPRVLRRHAEDNKPSFDELVRSVTTDHRPAALLEELRRLELIDVDEEGSVSLRARPFLSRRSAADRLLPLADNLGDHASATVTNILADDPPFLERSVFSDELSEESAAHLHQWVRGQWKHVHDELIKEAIKHESEDKKAGRVTNSRIRMGMYFYSEQNKQDRDDHE